MKPTPHLHLIQHLHQQLHYRVLFLMEQNKFKLELHTRRGSLRIGVRTFSSSDYDPDDKKVRTPIRKEPRRVWSSILNLIRSIIKSTQ